MLWRHRLCLQTTPSNETIDVFCIKMQQTFYVLHTLLPSLNSLEMLWRKEAKAPELFLNRTFPDPVGLTYDRLLLQSCRCNCTIVICYKLTFSNKLILIPYHNGYVYICVFNFIALQSITLNMALRANCWDGSDDGVVYLESWKLFVTLAR